MPIKESYEKALHQAAESAPYYRLLQLTLERIDTGFARFRMPFRSELTQVYGLVHGGAIASLADTAVAFALMTLVQPGERVTTVEFKINYLRPVSKGEMFARNKNWQNAAGSGLVSDSISDMKSPINIMQNG